MKARHDEQVQERPRVDGRADIAALQLLFWSWWNWCGSADCAGYETPCGGSGEERRRLRR